MSVFNYDSVRGYSLDEEDERELVEAQKECTFIWANKEGWPVGVIMSYVWKDGAFWLSISSLRVRVAAVTRDPRVAVCVTSLGTSLPSGRTITYKGRCEVFADEETKAWFLPALAERLRPGGYLLVGHSESLSAIKHPLQPVQPAIYLKPKA